MKTAVTGALMGLLLLGGCAGMGPGDREEVPGRLGLTWHECAGDVEIAFTTEHRCGTLTVPLDHDDQGGRTLDLAVVEASPAKGRDTDEVAISVGFNFGERKHPPGSMPPLADRIAVDVVALAPRGVGADGGTSLDCPELDGFGPTVVGVTDVEARGPFVDAIRSCHDRLVADGVDLDLFGVDDIAEDVERLRAALGVDRWYAMITYGEMSRVSDVLATAYGDRIRVLIQDSPLPWGLDSFASAGEGTRSALAALFAECRDDPACERRYPHLNDSWQQALKRVTAKPLSARSSAGDVLIDAAKLLRVVRGMLAGDGPVFVPDLPRVITAAADGRVHPTLAAAVAADPDICFGHRPICPQPGFSMGAYFAQKCPELGPAAAENDPLYRQVLADSAYVEACEVWDVEAADPAPAPDEPRLVLIGDLDSWSRPEWFEDTLVVRGATHDVSGSSQCVHNVRNPWIADPAEAPNPRHCQAEPFPAWD